jgi:type II restriction enzyme
MRAIPLYAKLGLPDEESVFQYLVSTFSDAVRTWDYFVNWDKVFRNSRELEVQLGIWNYLLGKEDFDSEFRYLVAKYPEIVMAIPSLIVRDGANSKRYQVLMESPPGTREIQEFDFTSAANSPEAVEQALLFIKESGLQRIFLKDGVKNLFDYLLGVEAGVDSNGRKNRSGTGMENLIEEQVRELVDRNPGWKYLPRVSQQQLQSQWGISSVTGEATRVFDFAILADTKLVLLEVNIYGGGGSKLKSVAGEFVTLNQNLKASGATLVWVTDGLGWTSTKRALRDSFNNMDYVINLSLLSQGALEEIISLK